MSPDSSSSESRGKSLGSIKDKKIIKRERNSKAPYKPNPIRAKQTEVARQRGFKQAYSDLQSIIPYTNCKHQLPKIKVLNLTIKYINHLQQILNEEVINDTMYARPLQITDFEDVLKEELKIKNTYIARAKKEIESGAFPKKSSPSVDCTKIMADSPLSINESNESDSTSHHFYNWNEYYQHPYQINNCVKIEQHSTLNHPFFY
uniref:BHLH domain-containing protein n=1 Tax=Rhabditophanes sp. KR3021 TaxID=114890 RepID=A0AC35TKN6_9BILA